MLHGVEAAATTSDMHHIFSIADRPDLRMQPSNWLSLCRRHHTELEGDSVLGMQVKRWSEDNYERLMGVESW